MVLRSVPRAATVILAAIAALSAAACGGSASASHSASTPQTASQPGSQQAKTSTSGSSGSGGAGALAADAKSAATGDIPDNQVFLAFVDKRGGWSMKYPEGWTQHGSGANVTFADKNNLVHVLVAPGRSPTLASAAAQLRVLQHSRRSLSFSTPVVLGLPAGRAVKVTYTTHSAPNPVTGKRVTLVVDRYLLRRGSRVATVDLGTPRGVDNVDAYRMMIDSFRWR